MESVMLWACAIMSITHLAASMLFALDGDSTGAAWQMAGVVVWCVVGAVKSHIYDN